MLLGGGEFVDPVGGAGMASRAATIFRWTFIRCDLALCRGAVRKVITAKAPTTTTTANIATFRRVIRSVVLLFMGPVAEP